MPPLHQNDIEKYLNPQVIQPLSSPVDKEVDTNADVKPKVAKGEEKLEDELQ